ncbi:hypothetical protein QT711_14320 [Sporosarcina saromensis]|uniref:Tripartite tricarboxylate transporter TctB family protein n=1 Tax=Sporosarcina saromensis TaxID=359365 RepID=A0ABU4GBL9_9BACL|nr:hypothetical protein [Sporosarcina saromensis]MDW0114369.1 hypothetical protein [Sporosarcina saromensis]
MEQSHSERFNIPLLTILIIFAFILLFFSDLLSKPIISEINAGMPIVDLMFKSDDKISFLKHLVIPLLLLIAGLLSIFVSIKKIVIEALFESEETLNKILLIFLTIILIIVSVKALLNTWALVKIALLCMFVVFMILAILGAFQNNNSKT